MSDEAKMRRKYEIYQFALTYGLEPTARQYGITPFRVDVIVREVNKAIEADEAGDMQRIAIEWQKYRDEE